MEIISGLSNSSADGFVNGSGVRFENFTTIIQPETKTKEDLVY